MVRIRIRIFICIFLNGLISFGSRLINSGVVLGLYYGFLTTMSIGPSYCILLQTEVMEERQKGTPKRIAAKTGFSLGQLILFISIYYTPLHIALRGPHTITALALPYLFFQFFWNNHKHFFDYGSTKNHSIQNLNILGIFLNTCIFQLLNFFVFPSATLARLVSIYMFRCNNKTIFVTSSFFGWLIGHIFFMKGAGLVLVWIQQKDSIQANKYRLAKLKNYIARFFRIFLFISCVYDLGRVPSPLLTKKIRENPERRQRDKKKTKQQEEEFIEENSSPSLLENSSPSLLVNGKDKTKDELHLYLQEASDQNSSTSDSTSGSGNSSTSDSTSGSGNSSTSDSGNRDNSEEENNELNPVDEEEKPDAEQDKPVEEEDAEQLEEWEWHKKVFLIVLKKVFLIVLKKVFLIVLSIKEFIYVYRYFNGIYSEFEEIVDERMKKLIAETISRSREYILSYVPVINKYTNKVYIELMEETKKDWAHHNESYFRMFFINIPEGWEWIKYPLLLIQYSSFFIYYFDNLVIRFLQLMAGTVTTPYMCFLSLFDQISRGVKKMLLPEFIYWAYVKTVYKTQFLISEIWGYYRNKKK